METNQNEGSCEESGRLYPEHDNGTCAGRSYECVFCKRGFTTAQALGGHMNIHRKERSTKPRLVSDVPSVSKIHEESSSFRPDPSLIQTYPSPSQHHHHYAVPHHDVHINYEILFPQSSSLNTIRTPSSHTNYGGDVFVQTPQDKNLLAGDWRRSLSLRIGSSCAHDNQDKVEDCSEDDDLDLELRLGHDP